MSDPRSTVLFMDDELGSADVVRYAVEGLQDAGFDVSGMPRMSEALDGFYRRYFHVFVLDIDMSFVQDIQDGSGTDVGRFLRSLDSTANIIVFSARGGVDDWFAAANHHLFGYIDKGDPDAIDRLVALAREARDAAPSGQGSGPLAEPPRRALLAVEGGCVLPASELADITGRALPGWELERADGLEAAAARLAATPERYGTAAIFADTFAARPGALRQIRAICDAAPWPHPVFGCLGRSESRPSLLALVCARPFRLVDLAKADAAVHAAEALSAAAAHFGRAELLAPDPNGLRRLQLEFGADVLADMGHGPELDDPLKAEE